MATNYPGALDNTTILKNDAVDATLTETTHPAAHNNVADAILAIETELGITPSGAFATVAAAIAALDAGSGAVVVKAPTADQIILPTADKINLALRAFNSGQTSKVLEIRNAAGTVVSYIDKVGALSAASLAIGGTLLAASHLSNGVVGTGAIVLATSTTLVTPTLTNPTVTTGTFSSPALTGTPTAPTATLGDSSTKVATTAFVAAALGGANNIPTGTILEYAGNSAPTGFLLCDGSAYSRTTYSALFAIVSTNYGVGDGSTTFNIPDKRGRYGVGRGTHVDVDALGKSEGLTVTDRRPSHKHTLTHSTDGAHTHTGSSDSTGAHTHTLSGSTSTNGSHSHNGSTNSSGSHSHNYIQINASASVQFGGDYVVPTNWSTGSTGSAGDHSHSVSIDSQGAHSHTLTGSVASGGTHSHVITVNSGGSHTHTVTVGPQTAAPTDTGAFLVCNYIIKT